MMDMHWHFTELSELSELTPLSSDIISCSSTSLSTESDDNGIDSVLVFPDLALPEEICSEVIGCRKKGRRKGYKNKTPEQRKANKELSRELKNCKERKRVNNIRTQYERLSSTLGTGQQKKKFRKQAILNAAIDYIHSLEDVLANSDKSNEGSSTCTTMNKVYIYIYIYTVSFTDSCAPQVSRKDYKICIQIIYNKYSLSSLKKTN